MDSQRETAPFRFFAYLLYKDVQQYMEEHKNEYAAYLEDHAKEESVHVKKRKVKKS